jgi:hypothetical protein
VCLTNKDRNSIQASIFKKHIKDTHPSINSIADPPEHTLIIEADVTSSVATNAHKRVDEHLRQQIITTCGDADALWGTKQIDPALCIYVGAYLMCIDNKHLKDKVPRENGTLCKVIKVIGVKLKHNPQSYKWKNYYRKTSR